jgi:hypothetical protein
MVSFESATKKQREEEPADMKWPAGKSGGWRNKQNEMRTRK